MLTGASGIGKSETALSLISRGHSLIADDIVLLRNENETTLYGSCPEELQDFLQVGGLGVLNIRAMFGDRAIEQNKQMKLVIQLVSAQSTDTTGMSSLLGSQELLELEKIQLPQISIPTTSYKDLAVLIECAVRNQTLKLNGYDAGQDFIDRHHRFMKREVL